MGNLAHSEDVANDKVKSYQFTITVEEARRFGMPASGILEMLIANRAKSYDVIFPSYSLWSEQTGLPKKSIDEIFSRLVKAGKLKRVEVETGQRGFIYLAQSARNLAQSARTLAEHARNLAQCANDSCTVCKNSLHGMQESLAQCANRTIFQNTNQSTNQKTNSEIQEGLSPQVASLPRPSASDSEFPKVESICEPDLIPANAVATLKQFTGIRDLSSEISVPDEIKTLVVNPPFVSEPTVVISKMETVGVPEGNFGDLQAMIAQAVKAELEKSATSLPAIAGHSETRHHPVQGQEGAKMETTEASVPVVRKAKAPKAARPPLLPLDQDLPEDETKAVLEQLNEWLPSLGLKPEFETREFLEAVGTWVCARRKKYLQRLDFFKDAPPTFNAVKQQLTNIQKEAYCDALITVQKAGSFGYKNLEFRGVRGQAKQQKRDINDTSWHDQLAELLAMED